MTYELEACRKVINEPSSPKAEVLRCLLEHPELWAGAPDPKPIPGPRTIGIHCDEECMVGVFIVRPPPGIRANQFPDDRVLVARMVNEAPALVAVRRVEAGQPWVLHDVVGMVCVVAGTDRPVLAEMGDETVQLRPTTSMSLEMLPLLFRQVVVVSKSGKPVPGALVYTGSGHFVSDLAGKAWVVKHADAWAISDDLMSGSSDGSTLILDRPAVRCRFLGPDGGAVCPEASLDRLPVLSDVLRGAYATVEGSDPVVAELRFRTTLLLSLPGFNTLEVAAVTLTDAAGRCWSPENHLLEGLAPGPAVVELRLGNSVWVADIEVGPLATTARPEFRCVQ